MNRLRGTLETSYFAKESLIKSDESTIYEAFENDLRYQKFTINAETLVTPVCETVLGKREQKAMMDNGYFLSRVPGTYGKNVNYLLVPNSQVFCSKDQKTYTAFLKKDQKPILFDGKFQIVHYAERKSTEELFRTSYDLSQKRKRVDAINSETCSGTDKKINEGSICTSESQVKDMIERRKTPWGMLVLLLIFILIMVYFCCGLYLLPGVALNNMQQKLLYIFMHPFQNWWTDRTISWMGVAFLGWIMFVAYYVDQYRNYQFGKENGTEQWGDVKKLSKMLRDPEEKNNTYLSKNIAVSDKLLSNRNMLIIGGSGSDKTTSVVTPNILFASGTNVILDIKGDLLRKHGNYLKAHGITVKSFNLINPEGIRPLQSYGIFRKRNGCNPTDYKYTGIGKASGCNERRSVLG